MRPHQLLAPPLQLPFEVALTHLPGFARTEVGFSLGLTDTLRSGHGRDPWTRLDPEFANSLRKTTIWTHPDVAGRPRM